MVDCSPESNIEEALRSQSPETIRLYRETVEMFKAAGERITALAREKDEREKGERKVSPATKVAVPRSVASIVNSDVNSKRADSDLSTLQ